MFVSNFHSDVASSTIQTSADVLHSPPVLTLPEFLIRLHPNPIPLASTLGHYDPDNPAESSTLCSEPSKPPSVSSKYTRHHDCNTRYYHTSTLRSHCPQLSCSTVLLVLATLATRNYLKLTANQHRRLTPQFVNTGIRAVLSSHDAMHCYIPL